MGVNFSGFIAWWLWRTIYLSKLPRLEKKVRVALGWTLDLFFSKDLVQFKTNEAITVPRVSDKTTIRYLRKEYQDDHASFVRAAASNEPRTILISIQKEE